MAYVEVDHFTIGEFALADRINRVYKERTGKHILHVLGRKWGAEGRRTLVTGQALLSAELMLIKLGLESHARHRSEWFRRVGI